MSDTDIQDAVPTSGDPKEVTEAREVINDNAAAIHRFVMSYLLDSGVFVHLAEALTHELFGKHVAEGGVVGGANTEAATTLLQKAGQDIVEVGFLGDVSYDLQTVVDGAASFKFLVRIARLVDPKVVPPEVIPGQEVVDALLVVFHYKRNTI